MKKICIVIGSRANYSSGKAIARAIKSHPKLKLQLVVGASAVLDRYGAIDRLIENDGFCIDAKFFMLIEGDSPVTMAKSTGLGLIELSSIFANLKPDVIVTIGDRFETMSTAIAASYMNIPLAHTMGGEVSGTIDESIRHAVTKLSHIHFAASQSAAERIVRMGEKKTTVFNTGCPRIDLIDEVLSQRQPDDLSEIFKGGVGASFDIETRFLLVMQHPVTTEYEDAENQMHETLCAVNDLDMPAIILWPNSDAGSDGISRAIRKFRETRDARLFHFFKNLPVDEYIWLMKKTVCIVGNSSSGIRDAAFIGTPVVNIGTRQNGRDKGSNVLDVDNHSEAITIAIKEQIASGPYPSDPVYGNGSSGVQIADLLYRQEILVQKTLDY